MSKDESDKDGSAGAAVVALLGALPWSAYVGKTLWWWFAVPLGAPAVATRQALGLMIIAAWWRSKPDQPGITMDAVFSIASTHAAYLGMGAIAHWLMVR